MFKCCIIGGGPAGLVLANTMRERVPAADIVILEAGGITEENKDAAKFISIGRVEYKPIRSFRLGGHGHLWGGACPRLHPDDFRMHSRFGLFVDWPIEYSDLVPYYEKAEELLNVNASKINVPKDILEDPLAKCISKSGYAGSLPYGNQRFFIDSLIPDLRDGGVVIRTKCVVRRIEERDGIVSILYHDLNIGATQKIDAECVVLCCGGLSNARILQLSKSSRFPDGIGNHAGLLGRYHMDHPRITAVLERNRSAKDHFLDADGRLPFAMVKPVDDKHAGVAFASISIDRANSVLINRGELDHAMRHDDIVINLQDRLKSFLLIRDQVSFDLETMDPPSQASALELAEELDSFGDPILATNVNIDHERAEVDRRVLLLLEKIFANEGYRVASLRKSGWTGQHPSGSTRMSARPEDGVVDSNLRVFGTKSVYVLGSSVFPTVGYSNPTLTIVSLALRLANHFINSRKIV
jgi:choline dehydrogenase-like flavoprotein